MDKDIQLLNARLAEALGCFGAQPRFQWAYAPEVYYLTRADTASTYTRHCWADQIGKCWMLCQWGLPLSFDPRTAQASLITEAQWWATYRGQLPYPAKGIYRGHPETALSAGARPTAKDTAEYIFSLRRQMGMSYEDHLRESIALAEAERLQNEKEFYAMADSDWPAFWKDGNAHVVGARGGPVSFGGIE